MHLTVLFFPVSNFFRDMARISLMSLWIVFAFLFVFSVSASVSATGDDALHQQPTGPSQRSASSPITSRLMEIQQLIAQEDSLDRQLRSSSSKMPASDKLRPMSQGDRAHRQEVSTSLASSSAHLRALHVDLQRSVGSADSKYSLRDNSMVT